MTFLDKTDVPPDLAKLLRAWRGWMTAQGLSERTIRDREYAIAAFFAFTEAELQEFTPDDIMIYVGRPGIKQASRATSHKHLRAYCQWLVVTGRRVDDPTKKTPIPKQPKGVPHPVTTAELVRILAAAKRRRARMMVLLASLQGLRVHEIAKIRGEDLDLDAENLTVTGKGNKTAVLPLHPDVAEMALKFPRKGYWFWSYECPGKPITRNSVTRAISECMDRAGVTNTPHSLRHWYATALVSRKIDLRTVQELMRHESLATTQIYVQVNADMMRTGIRTLRIELT